MRDVQKQHILTDPQAFAVSRRLMGQKRFKEIVLSNNSIDKIIHAFLTADPGLGLPGWFGQLAVMEGHWLRLRYRSHKKKAYSPRLKINPGLKIFSNTWKHLTCFFDLDQGQSSPEPGAELTMIWPDTNTGLPTARAAGNSDLLVLKMVLEHLTPY
jgi:hypothetical protein